MDIIEIPPCFPSNSDGHIALLDLFLTSSPNSCHALQLCPFNNSDHIVVSIDATFDSSIREETTNNGTFSRCQWPVWELFRDFLHHAPWINIFNYPVEKCSNQVSSSVIDIEDIVSTQKYQVKRLSSPFQLL